MIILKMDTRARDSEIIFGVIPAIASDFLVSCIYQIKGGPCNAALALVLDPEFPYFKDLDEFLPKGFEQGTWDMGPV